MKRYQLTLDLKSETDPNHWDWCSLLGTPHAGNIKVVSCQEYPTSKPPTQGVTAIGFDSHKGMGQK